MGVQQAYERVRQHDAGVAEWYRQFAMGLREEDGSAPCPNGLRGATLAVLQKTVGSLDGALGGDALARHLLVALLLGRGAGSTHDLTAGQAQRILSYLSILTDGGYDLDYEHGDMARRLVIAASSAGIGLPLPDQPDAGDSMAHLPDFGQPGQVPGLSRTGLDRVAVRPGTMEGEAMAESKSTTALVAEHAEAPLSATAKFVDEQGASWLFTMRAGVTGEMLVKFANDLSKASEYLVKKGFVPEGAYGTRAAAVGASKAAAPKGAGAKAAPKRASVKAQRTPQNPSDDVDGFGESGEFDATELVATSTGGKTYWKVKGGPFEKFGVTVWPETLAAAGMDVESLDTSQTYDLTGWTARWEQEGKYRKVVALIGDEVPADVAEDDGIPW